MTEKKICVHCNGDIAIRNPSGFCDHLYYPEYCLECLKNRKGNPVETLQAEMPKEEEIRNEAEKRIWAKTQEYADILVKENIRMIKILYGTPQNNNPPDLIAVVWLALFVGAGLGLIGGLALGWWFVLRGIWG